jgi:glycosyltransferase involved in cell wall biosynthesis
MAAVDRPRVLSLTPTALLRDSRTLKSAMAYARFGCESVVIEGIASGRDFAGLPIAVHAVTAGQKVLRRAGRVMLRRRDRGIGAALTVGAFFAYYLLVYCVQPLRVMRRASIYHLHSYEYFPLVRLWCALFGGRLVYDAHDFYSGIQNDDEMLPVQRRWIRPFLLWLETRCVARADVFLTVNDGTADLMQRQFGRRPLVLRNCHDFRLDRSPVRNLRDVAGIGAEDLLVVATGNWKPGHATGEAIEALRLVPDKVHLAFVGAGYEACRELAERKGLAKRVHLVGAVAADEVVPFIASADAALVLYHRHNANYANALPNGFFQSLAAGLPLVYSDLPGMTSAAAPYDPGPPVDPRSSEAIASALRRVLLDPLECRARREAARRFSTSINFEKEEKILRQIVDASAARGTGAWRCAE